MHVRACVRWRAEHAAEVREGQVRDRLAPSPEPSKDALGADPLRAIAWPAAQAVMGVEGATVVARTGEVMLAWARDALRTQQAEIALETGRLLDIRRRDASRGPSP
jgi:hypothetical protein